MAITAGNPYQMVAAGTNPGAGMPSLNLPGVSMSSVNPTSISTSPDQVYSLLAQAPQSLSATIGPLLQQVFGTQGNLMQPFFQQQGAQGAGQAQSDAMRRGLTGSSIEAANMSGAYNSANQGYAQYLAQQLSSLVPAYSSAVGQDISGQRSYYTDLAQAVGQQYASQISQQQFQKQLDAGMQEAQAANKAQMWSAGIGAVGSIGGGMARAGMFSDVRLKKTLFPIAKWKGLTIFLFEYNDRLPDLPKGPRVGFLAHEVAKLMPNCVSLERGFLKVDYPKVFGLKLVPVGA